MDAVETRAWINQYIWSYNASDLVSPRSRLRHYLQIMVMVGRDLVGGMLTLRAMSLVYTTLLSIVPLLAVSLSVLKGFGVHDQLEPTLVKLLAPLGERSVEISSRIVGFVDNMKIGVLGALGLSLLIFTVVSLIQKIESAFNHTWRLQSSRNLMQRFSNYLSVVLVGPVLMFSAVGITASLSSNTVLGLLNELPYMNDLIRFSGKLLPYLLIIGAFTFIYLLVPNTRVKPRSALFGAIIAGILWETSGVLFTSFVGGSTSYTAIYSGFAIMLMFMIWLYLSWLILLVGSSIAYYHQHPERLKWQKRDFHLSARMREQLVLQIMVNIGQRYDQQSHTPTTIDNLASYQQVPVEVLDRMLTALEDDGMILRSNDRLPNYIPAKSLNRIRLIDILRCSREAEDNRQRENLHCDPAVDELMRSIETQYEARLGDQTLADFLAANPLNQTHEDSIV
ncbi:MAG: YihY family inner membrane protein [Gammaproteobacteria bacterium]|nr:YihY family inner membrane protein [Gammaproteobacteria bacterium]